MFETVLALKRQVKGDPIRARTLVLNFLLSARIDVAEVNERTAMLALDAHAVFGKGGGHPARLNFGDCFSYAMAKQHRVPLLYKGDDFAQTIWPEVRKRR